jgi:hypothetical protein
LENSTASYQYKQSFQAVFLVASTELAVILYHAASTEMVAAANFGRRPAPSFFFIARSLSSPFHDVSNNLIFVS